MLGWTIAVLLAPAVLWLVAGAHQRLSRRASAPAGRTAAAPSQALHEADRKQAERGAPADVGSILAVERSGVPLRVLRARVALAAPRAATALALPQHGAPVAPEAEAMPEKPAAQHQLTRYPLVRS